jgi:DNA repair exonuclease SbcCD ATPase subunit
MIIKLRNFRCHKEIKFEIPDSGLVLLSGVSGTGKSTLLKAILHALYGKLRKPYSFGTNACSVYLEFLGMRIFRSNQPNRLVVNDTLEDQEAQYYINKRLGMDYEQFCISSYISQKSSESILSMTQSHQFTNLKLLAFYQNENEKHHSILDSLIQESTQKLIEYRCQTQTFQTELTNIQEQMTPIEFPLSLQDNETEEHSIARYRHRMTTFNNRMNELLNEKNNMASKFQNYMYLKADLDIHLKKKEELENDNSKLKQSLDNIHIQIQELLNQDCEEQLNIRENIIEYYSTKHELDTLETKFNMLLDEEKKEKRTELLNIKKTLWVYKGSLKIKEEAESELEIYTNKLENWKEYTEIMNSYQSIKNKIDTSLHNEEDPNVCITWIKSKIASIRQEIEKKEYDRDMLQKMKQQAEFEKTLLVCPVCDVSLQFKDNILHEVEENKVVHVTQRDYETDIQEIKDTIDNLQSQIETLNQKRHELSLIEIPSIEKLDSQTIEFLTNEIKNISRFLEKNKIKEKQVREIEDNMESGLLSSVLRTLKHDIDCKKINLSTIIDKINHIRLSDYTTDISILREEYIRIKDNLNMTHNLQVTYKSKKTEYDSVCKELKMCISKLDIIYEKMSGLNGDAIKRKLTDIEIQINRVRKKQTEDEELMDRVNEYIEYKELLKQEAYWKDKFNTASLNMEEFQHIHNAHLRLRDLYSQAELLALESTISSINEHTKFFLDSFFIEYPITAKIQVAQKSKKLNQLKISSYLNYKGNEYDSVHQLSGGELDRCNLASICGVNTMLNSPILILDESLASLDADTNTEIINFLKELGQDKLILVCSHEAVRGIFDTVITLD